MTATAPIDGYQNCAEDPIHAARQILVSGRGYGFGLAEDVQAEVDIVDQQIEHAAAALRGIGEPGAPGRRGAAPAKNGGAHRAQPAGSQDIRPRHDKVE